MLGDFPADNELSVTADGTFKHQKGCRKLLPPSSSLCWLLRLLFGARRSETCCVELPCHAPKVEVLHQQLAGPRADAVRTVRLKSRSETNSGS